MLTIWNKKTGEALQREPVDAREILAASPDLYTGVDPTGHQHKAAKNVNVSAVADAGEFARQPIGSQEPLSEPVGLRAVHRGRGSYSIMSGDLDVEEAGSLDKSEAATFNAMDEAGKAEFVAGRKTAA